jgi:hypothetical protein
LEVGKVKDPWLECQLKTRIGFKTVKIMGIFYTYISFIEGLSPKFALTVVSIKEAFENLLQYVEKILVESINGLASFLYLYLWFLC